MGYQTLLDNNLNKAFNLSKDLAKEVIFVRKPNPNFNFKTGEASFSTSQNITTKAIIYESKKTSKERNTMIKELLLKSKEIGDATLYDSVKIDNQNWNIVAIPKNNGFVSIIQISKEV